MRDELVTEVDSAPRQTLWLATLAHQLVKRQLVVIEAWQQHIVRGQQRYEASVLLLQQANRVIERTRLWLAASRASDEP